MKIKYILKNRKKSFLINSFPDIVIGNAINIFIYIETMKSKQK
jgi:hypothetical protein